MTTQEAIVVGILLWIMSPFLIVAVLLAPLALMTLLEQGRHALQHSVDIMRHTYARGE